MATVLGLLIVASGCSSKMYDEQVDSGKKAIEKGEYADAVNSFEKAAKDKSTDEIQKYIRLANDMKDSATALKEEKYEVAIANAEKVTKEKTDDKIFKSAKEQADKIIKTAKSSQEQQESTKKEIKKQQDTVTDKGEITEHEAEDLLLLQFNFSTDLVVQYNNDDENGNFVIQVYEDHPDHTATLGWFAVNPKTKKVTKIQL